MNAINTTNEVSMLRKFHIKAFRPNNINLKSKETNSHNLSTSGRLQLKNDLQLLINSHSLPTGLNTKSKVLVINSDQDYILANQTKKNLIQDLVAFLEKPPSIMNLQREGHLIYETKNIKKIKHWLESNYANNMVTPS